MFNRTVYIFVFCFSLTIGVFWAVYEWVLRPNGYLDHLFTETLSISIVHILNALGYDSKYTIGKQYGETFVFISPVLYPIVKVGASCNALELFVLFAVFIVFYPGNWKKKLWYIPLGILIIHVLNIVRNVILTLMAYSQSVYYDFFHRYVFVFVIYGAVFYMWWYWTDLSQHKHGKVT